MFGIGFATSFAFIIQAVSLSFHFRNPMANCEINPKLAIWENFRKVISIGSGLIIQAIFGIVKIVVMNYQLVLLIGLGGVSAYAIQNNVQSIFCLLPVALGTTVIALAGVYL